MDSKEIVPRRGPPSVDYKISDRKVNQIYIAILGHSYIAISILAGNLNSGRSYLIIVVENLC